MRVDFGNRFRLNINAVMYIAICEIRQISRSGMTIMGVFNEYFQVLANRILVCIPCFLCRCKSSFVTVYPTITDVYFLRSLVITYKKAFNFYFFLHWLYSGYISILKVPNVHYGCYRCIVCVNLLLVIRHY